MNEFEALSSNSNSQAEAVCSLGDYLATCGEIFSCRVGVGYDWNVVGGGQGGKRSTLNKPVQTLYTHKLIIKTLKNIFKESRRRGGSPIKSPASLPEDLNSVPMSSSLHPL